MNGYVFNAGDFPGSSAESSQHTFLIIIAVVFVLSVIALIIYLKCKRYYKGRKSFLVSCLLSDAMKMHK